MKTLEWLYKHLPKLAFWTFVLFFILFLYVVVVPDSWKEKLRGLLGFSTVDLLPTPRNMHVDPALSPGGETGSPQEVPFTAYVRNTNAVAYRTVKKGDTLYGIIHTDLINKQSASFMLYIKDENGVPGLSQRVPVYGVVSKPGYVSWKATLGIIIENTPERCWLEIRNDVETDDPRQIYFARIPVTCN